MGKKELTKEIIDQHRYILQLEERLIEQDIHIHKLKDTLEGKLYEIRALDEKINELIKTSLSKKPVKKKYAGSVSFDFWPLTDWFRLKIDKWEPGKYFQITIGPVRFDFFQD